MSAARRLTIIRRHLPSVDSTNTYAKSNMSKFDPNYITMITAGEQTAGRGRLGRTWTSTKENADITATFAFRIPPESMPCAYQLSPLLALSASKALAEHGVDAAIKWPNDLIIGTSNKVGGILCELENVDGKFWAALGIGMNINSMPDEIGLDRPVWPLSTLRAHYGKEFDVAKLTNSLADQFEGALDTFVKEGFSPFQAEYERLNLLLGKRVRFSESGVVVTGKVLSIGADGKLYMSLENGASKGYLSGEVSGIELIADSDDFVHGFADGK